MKAFLSATLGAILGGFIVFSILPFAPNALDKNEAEFIPVNWIDADATSSPVTPIVAPTPAPLVDLRVAANVSVNAVVHVKTAARAPVAFNPWMEFWGVSPTPRIREGSGSGVIIDQAGFILTNYHVIQGAERIEVSLNDRRTFSAEVVGTDPGTDLAVLRLPGANGLPALTFGSSDALDVGEWVLAVGNPFDLTSTVTAGIVSAKARNLRLLQPDYQNEVFPVESFIQTDAAVNPGNSGGALVNASGELIGINTAIASQTGSYAGYAFAVPSSIAKKVCDDLIAYGRVQRAFIGISGTGVTSALAMERDLKEVRGVWVQGVVPNGGAEGAGIAPGDVILAINGQPVNTISELQEEVARHDPGDVIDVTVAGTSSPIPVTLRDLNGDTELKNQIEWIRERS